MIPKETIKLYKKIAKHKKFKRAVENQLVMYMVGDRIWEVSRAEDIHYECGMENFKICQTIAADYDIDLVQVRNAIDYYIRKNY